MKNKIFCIFVFLFFISTPLCLLNAEEKGTNTNLNIKIDKEYVNVNNVEARYLAYTKIKEAEKTLYRLKQSTNTSEFIRKSTQEQREEINNKIVELEGILSKINEDNLSEKDSVKVKVKLQSIIDDIELINNVIDYTFGFAPKFIVKTGVLASSKYVFLTPVAIDFDIFYQLNQFVNPFAGMTLSVPVLLNHRNDILTSGYETSKYAVLLEAKFGNLFKFHKNHYSSLFFKIGGLLGHQSSDVVYSTRNNYQSSTEKRKVVTKTNPLGESVITGVGLEYFFMNKLVVGLNFDLYSASSDSPVMKKTNFVFGVNVGYNFCSGNKSDFYTNSDGKTEVYKTIWE